MLGATVLDTKFEEQRVVKKAKKHKKDKKKHKTSKKSRGNELELEKDAGSRTSSSDDNAVPAPEAGAVLEREDWMTKPSAASRPLLGAETPAPPEKPEFKEPEVHIGLRIMKPAAVSTAGNTSATSPEAAGVAAAQVSVAPASARVGAVGDGGASWRVKALRRSQAAAKESGQDVASVVTERFGSLTALTAGLTEQRAANERAHLHAAHERRGGQAPQARVPRDLDGAPGSRGGDAGRGDRETAVAAAVPHYLAALRTDAGHMKRPDSKRDVGSAGLSWRRHAQRQETESGAGDGGGSAGSGGGGNGDKMVATGDSGKAHTGSFCDSEPDQGAGDRGNMRGRDYERDSRRDSEQNSERRSSGAAAEPSRHGHDDRVPRAGRDSRRNSHHQDRDCWEDDRNHHRRESSWHPHGYSGGDVGAGPSSRRAGHLHREDQQADGDHRRASDGRRDAGGGGGGMHWKMSSSQAAALREVAPALNKFARDGGFMERFRALEKTNVAAAAAAAAATPAAAAAGIAAAPEGPSGSPAAADCNRGSLASLAPSVGAAELRTAEGDEVTTPAASATEAAAGGTNGERHTVGVEMAPLPANDGGSGSRDADEGGNRALASALRRRAHANEGAAATAVTDAAPAANKSVAALLKERLKAGRSISNADIVDRASFPPAAPPPGLPHAPRATRPQRPGDGGHNGDERGDGRPPARRAVEQLPLVDAGGRAAPGAFGRDSAGQGLLEGTKRGGRRVERYDEDGKKTRYFADDDDMDLQTLYKRAKYGDDGDADMDKTVTENVLRQARFKAADLGVDEEYDHDGGLELYEKRGNKGNREQREVRERSRQVSEHQRAQNAQGACTLCLASLRRPGHLLISAAAGAYLALPVAGRLATGHCVIVPCEHVASMRQLDEHIWEEVKNFMKCLVKMCMAQGLTPLFMETAMHVNTPHHHAVMECVPLPRSAADKAPAYFAKGIDDATGEWSQHHSKRRIEITATKTLRNAVPPNFPYFYVQFGWGAGFCHVIDDEAQFDPAFGRQVAIGLLKLPAEDMHRRIKAESTAAQVQWAGEFRRQWAPHDWTAQL